MSELCVVCHKNEVSWPLVCEDCTDKEAQIELFNHYLTTGEARIEQDDEGNLVEVCDMKCRTCGMIYDGGMSCNYCGDLNPLDQDDFVQCEDFYDHQALFFDWNDDWFNGEISDDWFNSQIYEE